MTSPASTLRRVRGLSAVGAIILLGTSLLACAPAVETHGFVPKPEAFQEIEIGVTTEDQVWTLLGTPTSRSTIDERRWYYVTRITERLAFYDPDFIDGAVIVVEFDESGTVSNLGLRRLDEGTEIVFVDRQTPTQGRDLGILEQLFGNLGRFERGSEVPPGGRRFDN